MTPLWLILALAAAPQDQPSSSDRAEDARMDAPFEQDAPSASPRHHAFSGWTYRDEFQRIAGSVWIFQKFDWSGIVGERPRIIYVAHRLERRRNAPDTIRWTDSDACPALLDRLRDFEAISPPRLTIPGLDEAPRETIGPRTRHGLHYTLWTRYVAEQADGHPADVSVSSNGGPIAAWGRQTTAALADCWRADEPLLHLP